MSTEASLRPLSAILFDLDGVLADSELWWDQIDAAMLLEHGVRYGGEHKREVLGKSFTLSLEFYRDRYRLRTTIEGMMLRRRIIAADFYAEKIQPYPASHEVLAWLRERRFRIALATSSVRPIVAPFLDKHDLTRYFDAIVTGEDVERGKPHPDIYLRAAALTNTEPNSCLVVEDALSGVAAGKSAGARVAAIPDRRFVEIDEYVDKADFILNDLGELRALVERLS